MTRTRQQKAQDRWLESQDCSTQQGEDGKPVIRMTKANMAFTLPETKTCGLKQHGQSKKKPLRMYLVSAIFGVSLTATLYTRTYAKTQHKKLLKTFDCNAKCKCLVNMNAITVP